jgi:GNAT superfamily N-acetyltransferase
MAEPDLEITVAADPDECDGIRAVVLDNLRAFNREKAEPPGFRPLAIAARLGGDVIGGIVGETGWKWLYVELLWVSGQHRGQGVGRKLLHAAESEAIGRGMRHVYLDTFDFQARPFYEREGYEVFGTLDDYPPGHQRFFLRKDI